MQRRLLACGARPINNVVDITNYALFEYGQPLHAFDFNRLAEKTLVVRRAKPEEPIATLDGISRKLSADTLVIADARQAVAVAGIMGGMGSEVVPTTNAVLLESARFDPVTVRRAARRLGLASESSYRFERGVDPDGVEAASRRAAELICELAGGNEVARLDLGHPAAKRKPIALDPQRLTRWLGIRMDPPTIRTTLARLSCRVASAGASGPLQVTPPSFRQDLAQEVDLYEELARAQGYDAIPSTVPTAAIAGERSHQASAYERTRSLKGLCASLGLTETITWSLMSEANLERYGYSTASAARLANPLSQDHAYLRPSLIPGLMQAIRRNLTQGAVGVRLFEVGRVVRSTEQPARERAQLGIALAGLWLRDWRGKDPCDFFKLKGLIDAVVGRLWRDAAQFVSVSLPWAEPGQGADITVGGRVAGVAGQVSQAILQSLDLDEPAWVAELAVEDLRASGHAGTEAVSAPAVFPPVKRDLSILVDQHVPFEAVRRAIGESGGALADRVELIDRYAGAQVPTGKVSLTFSIEYRDATRTLTAEEADARHQRITQELISRFQAQLR